MLATNKAGEGGGEGGVTRSDSREIIDLRTCKHSLSVAASYVHNSKQNFVSCSTPDRVTIALRTKYATYHGLLLSDSPSHFVSSTVPSVCIFSLTTQKGLTTTHPNSKRLPGFFPLHSSYYMLLFYLEVGMKRFWCDLEAVASGSDPEFPTPTPPQGFQCSLGRYRSAIDCLRMTDLPTKPIHSTCQVPATRAF